jgi:hypothetical protein
LARCSPESGPSLPQIQHVALPLILQCVAYGIPAVKSGHASLDAPPTLAEGGIEPWWPRRRWARWPATATTDSFVGAIFGRNVELRSACNTTNFVEMGASMDTCWRVIRAVGILLAGPC